MWLPRGSADYLLTVAGVLVWIVGCGITTNEPSQPSRPSSSAQAVGGSTQGDSHAVDPPTEISSQVGGVESEVQLGRIPTAAENPIPSPSQNDWQSEAFTEVADSQLRQIAELLESNRPVPELSLRSLVQDSFQCGPLRPDDLSSVFEDPSLAVLRSASGKFPTSPVFRGPTGLARALDDVLEPLTNATDVHGHFKIHGVTIGSKGTTTEVMLQVNGTTADRIVQQTARWRIEWKGMASSDPPRLHSISLIDYEQSSGRHAGGPLFADCTPSVLAQNESYTAQLAHGLDYWLDRLEQGNGIFPSSYHGLAVGDVNGDGLDDLYVCQPGGLVGGLPNRLYQQQPDGTARDVSQEAGVDWLLETPSALFVDLDNDGDQDLVAATVAGVIVTANDGSGRFQPKVAKLIPDAPPIALSAVDFDNDGDLDIYACCYSRRAASQLRARPIPYHDANNGARNVLFRNDHNWRFVNVTKQVGLEQNNHRFSFASSWEDFDNDGDQDLYVANDFGRNCLYRNDAGRFTDVAALSGVEDIAAGMSVSWGDYNNDGWMDLYVGNMWSSAGNRVAYQRNFLGAGAERPTLADFQRHARGNSLFSNRGPTGTMRFGDVSAAAHVTVGRWAWSSLFVDINNDGRQDLMVANGNITQEDSRDRDL